MTKPLRSVLYLPASNPRAIEKARGLPADGLIFDLEDAVAQEAKPDARAALRAALATGGFGRRTCAVRINGPETEWGGDDIACFADARGIAILVPKVADPAVLDAIALRAPGQRLWAMIETPGGVLASAAIAAHPAVDALVVGTNDLARDLRCRDRGDRLALTTALGLCLLAARTAGIVCLDGVYNAFHDEEGLRAECLQGRDLGMDGKTLIHPAQIATANEIYGPSRTEIDLAERQIAAHELALRDGSAVAVLDGRIVEALHVEAAHVILALKAAIDEMET